MLVSIRSGCSRRIGIRIRIRIRVRGGRVGDELIWLLRRGIRIRVGERAGMEKRGGVVLSLRTEVAVDVGGEPGHGVLLPLDLLH